MWNIQVSFLERLQTVPTRPAGGFCRWSTVQHSLLPRTLCLLNWIPVFGGATILVPISCGCFCTVLPCFRCNVSHVNTLQSRKNFQKLDWVLFTVWYFAFAMVYFTQFSKLNWRACVAKQMIYQSGNFLKWSKSNSTTLTLKCCINRCFCGKTELHSGHLNTHVTLLSALWWKCCNNNCFFLKTFWHEHLKINLQTWRKNS